MEWTVMVMSIGVAGMVVAYLTQPWWDKGQSIGAAPASESDQPLVKRREATLMALRDLDFDYEVDKVTAADYGLLRQNLLTEAAAVMTQLKTLKAAAEIPLDEQLEARILAFRRALHTAPQTQESLPTVPPGSACVNCGRPARFGDIYCTCCGTRLTPACPECGASIQTTDRFCTGCGIELALAQSG